MSRPQRTDHGLASDLYRRGRGALLQARLGEAQELLEATLAAEPEHPEARQDLAWAYYRGNDFASAADAFDGREASGAMVAKLRSFAAEPPYGVPGSERATLPFLISEPLPLVRINVEGRDICVLLDTGGAELILDTEFAQEIGVRLFGSQEGVFAGGKRDSFDHGRVERVALGEVQLERVPVHVLPTRRFSPVTGGRYQIEGIIGTNLLAQFRATLDYPAERLVLEPADAPEHVAGVTVPFETLGDHYMIADQGWLNGVGPQKFFVDSGLAGGAFTCPKRTLKSAGIPVPETADRGGVGGGGGPVRTGVFQIDELGLGRLRQRDLVGVYIEPAGDAPADRDERWDGLISHGFLRKYRWTIDFAKSVFVFA